MFTIFLTLITIVCFLLIIAVMVQNPKGGGLSSSIGGGSQMLGGVQKTTDFLDKSTWFLGAALIILILLSGLSFSGSMSDSTSKIINETETVAPKTTTTPIAPVKTPKK